MNEEHWETVAGFEDKYEVSNRGRVRTIGSGRGRVHGRILRHAKMPRGYLIVNLWQDNRQKMQLVHRLVAAAFLGAIPEGMQVNHIDGNKENNAIANLEIVTNEQNREHAIATGLIDGKGEKNPMAKISLETVLAIRAKHSEGMGYKKLAKHFDLGISCVRNVAARKTWKHV